MTSDPVSLGGFTFESGADGMLITTPGGSVTTSQDGFMRGIRHLLTMGMDLEGQAELDGGFIFRLDGERARLRLGAYAEDFRLAQVTALFEQLAAQHA